MSRSWLRRFWPVLLAGSVACSSSTQAGPEPEVALASSQDAQTEFRDLRQRWVATPLDARVGLERPLTSFVQAHPTDPQGRLARIYLAWISVQRGQLEVAERWAALAEPGAAGTARDLLQVIRAGLLLARGQPEQAYRDLLRLQGSLIDADDHLLCLDQLVIAALESKHYAEATHHILDLAAQAARRHRERTWRALEPRLASIPLSVLESSLDTLSNTPSRSSSVRPAERAAAIDWMRRQILELLSSSALAGRDVELAQRLVAAPSARDATEREKSELLLLATQGGLAPAIAGRTLGLALELNGFNGRQRSADVAAGIATTLDLSRADRSSDQVVLLTRQVESGESNEALARLAGDGAALLITGFDAKSARQAAEFSRDEGVPVLLLHEPEPGADLPVSALVVGADAQAVHSVLRGALSRRAEVIAVGSPEIPCPSSASATFGGIARAGGAGRPLALLFEGSAHCVRSVLMSLAPDQRPALVALGLDALTAVDDDLGAAAELWAIGAGRLPRFEGPRDAALARWYDARGRAPGWYEALGHDVARLAELALPKAAPEVLRATQEVAGIHRRISETLARAALPDLWTSDTGKFSETRRLVRDFRAVRVTNGSNHAAR